jgi:hypothetical protein
VTTPISRHTNQAKYAGRRTKGAGRRASRSRYLAVLARTGLGARGFIYVLIGWLAIEVAFGHSGHQADQSGALQLVGSSAAGKTALWLLFAGFVGLALWRLSEAAFGGAGPDEQKASARWLALGKAVLYGFVAFTVLKFVLGAGAPKSSNTQSQDLTATLVRNTAGQVLVVLIGVAVAGAGAYLAWQAWRKEFLDNLEFGSASPRTRRIVERLGQVGGIARGALFAAVGGFLIDAGVTASPGKAKGVDGTLRAFAQTPLGPWLLVVIAVGLLIFGVYSFCEAKWRKVQPGQGTAGARGGAGAASGRNRTRGTGRRFSAWLSRST